MEAQRERAANTRKTSMKLMGGILAASLSVFGSALPDSAFDIPGLGSRCSNAPKSNGKGEFSIHRTFSKKHFLPESLLSQPAGSVWAMTAVLPGAPTSYKVSGVAESAKGVIDVGDFTLHVKVVADFGISREALDSTEFELDLCTDVVGVECPLMNGDAFSGVVAWNALTVPLHEGYFEAAVVITAIQPEGAACGETSTSLQTIEEAPVESTYIPLADHLSLLVEDGETTTWTKSIPPRFELFTWEDARRIAGGTVLRGHLGFEELPRRTYPKTFNRGSSFLGAFSEGEGLVEQRRLRTKPDDARDDVIPVNFDGREAFPECASIIGRVRDQSDCGSCWAFASTEAFNDRRCIASIGKWGKGNQGQEAIADQLLVLSAEDTTACCSGFHCGMSMGCNGGQPGSAWKWFTRTGVVSGGDYGDIGAGTTCKPYEFMPCAHHVDPAASGYPACSSEEYPTPECKSECSEADYGGTYKEDKKMATEAYSLGGVKDIQLDIMKYGSVTAAFSVYSDFLTYSGGVYSNKSGMFMGGHAVKIIGWGTDDDTGEDYWLVVNSWNQSWGEDGLFRILRGVNECGIEGQIVAGEV